jgi:carboxylesterase type B
MFRIKRHILFLVLIYFCTVITNIYALSISKCSKNDTKQVIIETTSGRLSGVCEFISINDNNPKDFKSGNVYYWLGVPYAEPPHRENRFKPPQPLQRRSELIDAKKYPNSCIQFLDVDLKHDRDQYDQESLNEYNQKFTGFSMWQQSPIHSKYSEDCLYLNVYIPAEAYLKINVRNPNLPARKLPIMVFFHGGATRTGSSNLDVYNPVGLVTAMNVIVITVNYRLGVFGFFYLEKYFGGNQGILDQHEALKWIKTNSDRFGGDSERITLVGHSAGAALTGYHLFYEKSRHLFRNAIFQSGTPLISSLSPISQVEANRRARDVLVRSGCANDNSTSTEFAFCALNSPDLVKASRIYFKEVNMNNYVSQEFTMTAFVPVIDGKVIKDQPINLLRNGQFKKCPILNGFTTDEGTSFIAFTGILGLSNQQIKKPYSINHRTLQNFLKDYFKFYPNLKSHHHNYHESNTKYRNNLITDSILHDYTKIVDQQTQENLTSPLIKPNYFNTLGKIIGDEMFTCPGYDFANYLAKFNSTVYMYLFAHRISSTPWPRWFGATHGDELAFTFAHPIVQRQPIYDPDYHYEDKTSVNPWSHPNHRYLNSEKQLTIEIITYWSNFAKYNDPNGKEEKLKHWPPYTLFEQNFDQSFNASSNISNMTNLHDSGRYMILKTNGTKVSRGYSLEICQLWNSYLPKLIRDHG